MGRDEARRLKDPPSILPGRWRIMDEHPILPRLDGNRRVEGRILVIAEKQVGLPCAVASPSPSRESDRGQAAAIARPFGPVARHHARSFLWDHPSFPLAGELAARRPTPD